MSLGFHLLIKSLSQYLVTERWFMPVILPVETNLIPRSGYMPATGVGSWIA